MQTIRRPSQHPDETAIEFLRRVTKNMDWEPESLLDQLPSTEAVLDYFDLWHAYDTEYLAGVLAAIYAGADPKPFDEFVARWNLGWKR